MKIGYIGLGALGSELARRFLASHELCVWDLNPRAAARLGEHGARVMSSAREVAAESEVILLCLPRSSDVREVIFGPGGLADGLAPGKLVIDQTSGVGGETRAMAQQLARRGVEMMDAAVSANPAFVAQGGATLMASGPDLVFERALPVLREITQTIYRCGTRVGDGQAMKTVNNAMNGGCRLGTLEVAATGRKAGMSLECITATLNRGSGRNLTSERMLPAILRDQPSTNFGLRLMLKDVNQAVTLGMHARVPMPVTNAVRTLLQIGVNTLGPTAQLEDMIGLTEHLAATKLKDRGAAGNAVTMTAPIFTREDMRVGYVGLDDLGSALATRLNRSRILRVYDAQPERAHGLVTEGAVLASDLPALARNCDVVFLCLPCPNDVRRALLGEDGLVVGLAAGSVVIDQSTGDPRQTRRLAADLGAHGVTLLDAPVSDGPEAAAAGTAGILIGGREQDWRGVEPLLAAISPTLTYCGDLGHGHMAKLVNDSVSALCRVVTYECVAAGLKYGLKLQDMAKVLDRTSGWSLASRRLLPALAAGNASEQLRIQQFVQGLEIAGELAIELDAPMTIATAARSVFEFGAHALGAARDIGDLARLYAGITSTDFAVA